MSGRDQAVRHVDDDERRARLVTRHHLARTAAGPEQAVGDIVAMHSTDPATPFLGLWARVPEVSVADVEQALYVDRTLWRMHAMRRTLWVVTMEDGPDIVGAAGTDVGAKERRRLEGWIADSLGLEDPSDWIAQLEERVHKTLIDRGPLPTKDLTGSVEELDTVITIGSGRWTQDTPVSSRLLYVMAMDARINRADPLGSWRASQYRWVDTPTWFDRDPADLAPTPPPQARTRVAGRWLRAFGPGSTEDLKWWAGWTKRQTVAALEEIGAVPVTTEAGPAWLAPDDVDPVTAPVPDVVALLPGLDPTTMGWKERGFYLGDLAEFGGPLFDRNGNAGPTVWVDGRVVGAWAQRQDGTVVTELLRDVGRQAQARIEDLAEELQAWLGDHVVIPRFRTPLENELAGS